MPQDAIFKTASIQKETKVIDAELAQIQALIHDPVAPLIHPLHACDDDGSSLSVEDARAAVADAIRLLGNASAGMSRLRRKRILKSVNLDIADLAEENIIQSAAPNLFGSGFEAKMKERADRSNCSQLPGQDCPNQGSFFKEATPLPPREATASPTEEGPGKRGNRNPQPGSEKERDSLSLFNGCINPSIITLVQREVTPLEVDKAVIAGRLAYFKDNWSRVSQDQWILDTIRGYKIEFVTQPTQERQPRAGMSSTSEQMLPAEEIAKLLTKGTFTEVPPKRRPLGFYSSLFLVPKKDGGM